jgi:hypothetical protein
VIPEPSTPTTPSSHKDSTDLRGYRGFLLDAPTPDSLRGVRDGAILVDRGIILDAGEFSRLRDLPEARSVRWQYGAGCLLLPGLVDAWAFLPGYPATGRASAFHGAGKLWREEVLVPVEKNYSRVSAKMLAPFILAEMARHGTTTTVLGLGGSSDPAREALECLGQSPLRVLPLLQIRTADEHRILSSGNPPADPLAPATSFFHAWTKQNHGTDWPPVAGLHLSAQAAAETGLLPPVLKFAATHEATILLDLSTFSPEEQTTAELWPDETTGSWLEKWTVAADTSRLLVILPAAVPGSWQKQITEKNLRTISLAAAHCELGRPRGAAGFFGPTLHGSGVPTGPELGLRATLRASRVDTTLTTTLPQLLHEASAGAARLLGAEGVFGAFEPGQSADFSVWDVGALLPLPRPRNPADDFTAAELFALWLARARPEANLATYARGQNVWLAPPNPLL